MIEISISYQIYTNVGKPTYAKKIKKKKKKERKKLRLPKLNL